MDKVIIDIDRKTLSKLPKYILDKLLDWALAIKLYGIEEVRKKPGYHDEPLQGSRFG